MTKTTKNDKNTQTNKAAETRAAAEKALAEKRKAIKDTALYGKIKSAGDRRGRLGRRVRNHDSRREDRRRARLPRRSRWPGDRRVRAPCARVRDPRRGPRVGGLQDPPPVRRAGRGRVAQARRGVIRRVKIRGVPAPGAPGPRVFDYGPHNEKRRRGVPPSRRTGEIRDAVTNTPARREDRGAAGRVRLGGRVSPAVRRRERRPRGGVQAVRAVRSPRRRNGRDGNPREVRALRLVGVREDPGRGQARPAADGASGQAAVNPREGPRVSGRKPGSSRRII